MRFMEKLVAKRDAAKADYEKWQSMIDLVTTDPDFSRTFHSDTLKTMKKAQQLAAGNGNGHAMVPLPPLPSRRKPQSAATRKLLSRRMKKLWKEKRAVMLKGVRKGAEARVENLKAARG